MALGGLSALASIRGGGLLNYMMNRERMMNDPSFRAGLVGSPFAAGLFGISGSRQPVAGPQGNMPAAGGIVAPEDMQPGFVGPPAPSGAAQTPAPVLGTGAGYVPGYIPGQARQWQPNFPPYSPDVGLKQQAEATLVQGIQTAGSDLARGQAKIAAGIMPTEPERTALIGTAKKLIEDAGPGSTVKVDIPGMPMEVGSPYNLAPVRTDEYKTFGEAQAAANLQGGAAAGWGVEQTNRGTFVPVQRTRPMAPPTPVAPGTPPGAPAGAPAQTPAPTATTPAPAGGQKGGGGAIPAPTSTAQPPSPARPAAPARPAVAPTRPAAPAVQTGTPALTAGQIVIPTTPPAAPYPGAPMDQNAPAPSSVPYQGGQAPQGPAYPSPAFDDTATAQVAPPTGGLFSWLGPASAEAAEVPAPARAAPSGVPRFPAFTPPPTGTGIVAPALPVTPTPPGAAKPAVAPEMPAGTAPLPLQERTYTGQQGQTDVYRRGAQDELAADMNEAGITDLLTETDRGKLSKFNQLRLARQQREDISREDIRRMVRGPSEGEQSGDEVLYGYRTALKKFFEDFPDPAERDQFVGWIRRPALDKLMILRDDPRFKLFVQDLSPFQGFDEHKKVFGSNEIQDIGGSMPTGHEDYPSDFEQRLADFPQTLNETIMRRYFLRTLPVGAQTPAMVEALDQTFAAQRAAQRAAAEQAQQTPTETPPTITLAPTTSTTGPPTTTTSLPPLVVFGHEPAF